jgi:hypothetical protein
MTRPIALVLALHVLLVTAVSAAPRFRVVDLGFIPGGTAATPSHFGAPGTVLGRTDLPGTSGGHATRWDVSASGAVLATTDLQGLPGFSGSAAISMNTAGWIVGFSNTANPQPRAVIWRGTDLVDIERTADGNANVYALDVNDAGVVCGFLTKSGGGGNWDAAIWIERANQPGRFDRTNLPLHPSADPVNSWTEAQSIDELGRVFGRTNLGVGGDRVTLWEADAVHTPVLLEPLAGSFQSMPGDINDLGDAVGYTIYPFGTNQATRWSRDASHTPTVLPRWAGHNSASAQVVNPAGDVVLGTSTHLDLSVNPAVGTETRVVMWDAAGLWDLNQQLDASGAGWAITTTMDMNADGWILANATAIGVPHAVLLIPVPDLAGVGPDAAPHASLASPWPNPARGEVRLAFTLAHEGRARLTILDAQGRRVADVADGRFAAGRHEGTWSGHDAGGAPVGAGLYFASLETDAGRTTTRIVRVR